MTSINYRRYLKSQAWQKKRQVVFAKYGKRCYACGTMKPPIQVHHLDYTRLGKEALNDLMPLCKQCHDEVGRRYYKSGRRNLRYVTMTYVNEKRKLRKAK